MSGLLSELNDDRGKCARGACSEPNRLGDGACSGHVGDYVAWLTVGVAVFGTAFAFAFR
jgi:hypothetical protein